MSASLDVRGRIGLSAAMFLAAGLFAAPVMAHPHVFVSASVHLVGDGKGDLSAVRTAWVFDEMFSSALIMDFDDNANDVLEPEELATIGQTILGSAKDYQFFTFLKDNGRTVALEAPDKFRTVLEEGHLILLMEMIPQDPLALAKSDLTLSIYDPTYYVSFEVSGDDHVQMTDLPGACHASVASEPVTDGATTWLNQIAGLSKSQSIPADGVNYAELLSTKVNIACP